MKLETLRAKYRPREFVRESVGSGPTLRIQVLNSRLNGVVGGKFFLLSPAVADGTGPDDLHGWTGGMGLYSKRAFRSVDSACSYLRKAGWVERESDEPVHRAEIVQLRRQA